MSPFELFVSPLVWQEASGGDPTAAGARTAVLEPIPVLPVTEAATALAERLVEDGVVPVKAAADALHIAVAATHGIDFLLTWNCKHIANAETRPLIEQALRARGYRPPVLCTPQELMGGPDVD